MTDISIQPKVIRVCIVEDNPTVRESLSILIQGAPGLECSGAYPSGEAALKGVPQACPDVVLMDIELGGMSGIDCVRKLRALQPKSIVLMLTSYEDDDLIFQALKAGASGYLVKQTPPAELLSAIADVHRGGAPMSSSIARKVIQSFHKPVSPSADSAAKLTPREREILQHLARGYLYKEIADALSISFDTVHGHIQNIYHKLHVRSRTEAVAKFLSAS